MKKPELKVVRFEAEDVIATSGLSYRAAYYTKGTELEEEDRGGGYSSTWYTFTGNENGGPSGPIGTDTKPTNSGPYAWYDGSSNAWFTNNEAYNSDYISHIPGYDDNN